MNMLLTWLGHLSKCSLGFPQWVHSQGTRVRPSPGVPRAGGVAGALGVSPVAVVRLTSYLHEFFVLQKTTLLLLVQLLVLSSFPHIFVT